MKNLNPIHWVARLIKQVKVDFLSLESKMSQALNSIYQIKYYNYNCKRCGRNSNLELCDSCDY